jgi:RNA polymerase sigma factor (sigma-70 family)
LNKKISLEQIGFSVGYNDPHDQNEQDNREQLVRLKRILHQVICHRLTQRQKEILLLYYYENKSMPQIAEMLGIHKSTVSRTLSRARDNIRKYLEFYQMR